MRRESRGPPSQHRPEWPHPPQPCLCAHRSPSLPRAHRLHSLQLQIALHRLPPLPLLPPQQRQRQLHPLHELLLHLLLLSPLPLQCPQLPSSPFSLLLPPLLLLLLPLLSLSMPLTKAACGTAVCVDVPTRETCALRAQLHLRESAGLQNSTLAFFFFLIQTVRIFFFLCPRPQRVSQR